MTKNAKAYSSKSAGRFSKHVADQPGRPSIEVMQQRYEQVGPSRPYKKTIKPQPQSGHQTAETE